MTRASVLVTSRSFASGAYDGVSALHRTGADVLRGPADHDITALAPALERAVAWIAGTGPVTTEMLDLAPGLRLIARYGVGVDSVDLEAARERGIAVTNTPGANSAAVSDHALALTLAALRDVPRGDRGVRGGVWAVHRTREVASLCVAIVGAGRIGRGYADRLSALGAAVLAFDPWIPEADLRAAGIRPATLDEIAEEADVVSLHAPGGEAVVDEDWLAKVAKQPIIVNTARAALVDEIALAAALRDGRVAVYASDTLSAENGGASPLLAPDLTDSTIFTPHSAAQTVEAVDNMTRGAVHAVRALLAGDPLPHVVVPASDPSDDQGDQ